MNKRFTSALCLLCACVLMSPLSVAAGKDDAAAQQEVLKFENEWLNAYLKTDAAVLARCESDEFMVIDPAGNVKTKADEIRDLKSGATKWKEARFEDLKVRIHGKTAIVNGVLIITSSTNGKDVTGRYRFTDVLVQKKDSWRAVSAHASAIATVK